MSDKKGRRVTPFDLFRGSSHYCPPDLSKERYSICQSCEHFISLTKQCNQCGCFMHLKTKLKDAQCPVGKW